MSRDCRHHSLPIISKKRGPKSLGTQKNCSPTVLCLQIPIFGTVVKHNSFPRVFFGIESVWITSLPPSGRTQLFFRSSLVKKPHQHKFSTFDPSPNNDDNLVNLPQPLREPITSTRWFLQARLPERRRRPNSLQMESCQKRLSQAEARRGQRMLLAHRHQNF